jgi:hypothetical protein
MQSCWVTCLLVCDSVLAPLPYLALFHYSFFPFLHDFPFAHIPLVIPSLHVSIMVSILFLFFSSHFVRYLSVSLSVCLSVFLFVCLSACLSICLSVCLCFFPPDCPLPCALVQAPQRDLKVRPHELSRTKSPPLPPHHHHHHKQICNSCNLFPGVCLHRV